MTRDDDKDLERLTDAIRTLGSTAKPDPDWQDKVRAKVAAGLLPPRPSWLRRIWRRVTGGAR